MYYLNSVIITLGHGKLPYKSYFGRSFRWRKNFWATTISSPTLHTCTKVKPRTLKNYKEAKFCFEKGYNTWCSQAVSHPSTNQALRCLTSVIGREPVHSTWYGRSRLSYNTNLYIIFVTIFCVSYDITWRFLQFFFCLFKVLGSRPLSQSAFK